jgi:alkylation response protein AidB-like acyl-CoA dehydrogenase
MILNETRCAVRDPVRTFANEEIAPRAREFEKAVASPLALFEAVAGLGLIGIATPEIISGAGADYVSYAMALIEIAAADGAMSTILSIQNSLIVSALVKDGTAAQKAELLHDLIAGKTIGAFVLTEADAGSDASAVHTRATRVEGGYRLNCAKQFLASGCIAGLAAVFAVTDPSAKKRVSAFLVRTNSDGFHVDKVEHKLGQGASDTCAIRFDDVLVDERMRLGAEGASYGMAPANLEASRIGIAAQCVGMARAALAAIAYVRERKSFGSPIIAHQAVSFRLADLAAQLECLPRRAGLPDLRGHVRHSAHGDRMSAQTRRLGGRGLQIFAGAPFAGASFALHALARRRRADDEIASDCANRRQAFGKTLIGHEGVGFMLADNLIDLKQAELMIDWCADVLDAGALGTHESSMTKVAVSEALMRVADLCVQVVGGTGVSQDTIVEQVFREVRAFRIYDGPSEVHRWSLATKIKWDWKAAHS